MTGVLKLELPPNKWIKGNINVTDELALYDVYIRIYCAIEKKYLPDAERSLLTYYAKYGVTVDTDKLYADDFKRDKQMVSNLKYSLKLKGFLDKDEDAPSWKLPSFLKQRYKELTIVLPISIV